MSVFSVSKYLQRLLQNDINKSL